MLQNAVQQAQKFAQNFKDIKDIMGSKSVGKEPDVFEFALDLADKIMEVKDIKDVISFSKKLVDSIPKFTKIMKKPTHLKTPIRLGYKKTKKIWKAIPKDLADETIMEMRYVNNGLRTWQYFSLSEGAYYVLIDKSGSMAGDKTIWARSVALALYRLARMKRRKYFLRFFDTAIHPDKKPLEDPKEVLEAILKVKSGGGTWINGAIQTAIEDIVKNKLSEQTNTIVLITDGIDEVKNWKPELRKHNIKLISIMIDGDNDNLREASDIYMRAEPTEDGAIRLLKVAER